MWITVYDGTALVFEGDLEDWADCFFTNASRETIQDFCDIEGWDVEFDTAFSH